MTLQIIPPEEDIKTNRKPLLITIILLILSHYTFCLYVIHSFLSIRPITEGEFFSVPIPPQVKKRSIFSFHMVEDDPVGALEYTQYLLDTFPTFITSPLLIQTSPESRGDGPEKTWLNLLLRHISSPLNLLMMENTRQATNGDNGGGGLLLPHPSLSHQTGFLIGFLIGKHIQNSLPLPIPFDPSFIRLIFWNEEQDNVIPCYWDTMYSALLRRSMLPTLTTQISYKNFLLDRETYYLPIDERYYFSNFRRKSFVFNGDGPSECYWSNSDHEYLDKYLRSLGSGTTNDDDDPRQMMIEHLITQYKNEFHLLVLEIRRGLSLFSYNSDSIIINDVIHILNGDPFGPWLLDAFLKGVKSSPACFDLIGSSDKTVFDVFSIFIKHLKEKEFSRFIEITTGSSKYLRVADGSGDFGGGGGGGGGDVGDDVASLNLYTTYDSPKFLSCWTWAEGSMEVVENEDRMIFDDWIGPARFVELYTEILECLGLPGNPKDVLSFSLIDGCKVSFCNKDLTLPLGGGVCQLVHSLILLLNYSITEIEG